MNTRRGWFLVIGLLVGLLLGGGAYFLVPTHKSLVVAPNSPAVAVNTPDTSSPSEEGASASPADTTPSLQPEAGSAHAPAYLYNARGQLLAITYPDGSTYTYRYDAYGDKISETNGTGKTWCYVYDQNHHPISVIDPEGHITRKEAPPNPSNAN